MSVRKSSSDFNCTIESKSDDINELDKAVIYTQANFITDDYEVEEEISWNEDSWMIDDEGHDIKNENKLKTDELNDIKHDSQNNTDNEGNEYEFADDDEDDDDDLLNILIKDDCDGEKYTDYTNYCKREIKSISDLSTSINTTFLDDEPKKKVAVHSPADSFYGLPMKVKKFIEKTRGIKELYDWQDECLRLEAIQKRKNLIYALPTSGGKTLVAEILMLKEVLVHKRNVVFILPYVSIVQEKMQSMAPFALEMEFLLEEYAAGRGKYPPIKRRRKNTIYICTIEKAQGLLNSLMELERLNEIGMVVVDELHLIGEYGRGAILEVLLTKLIFINEDIHIVGMSATIGNLNEIATFLKAEVYTQNFRPVQLKEYVKAGDKIWLVDPKDEEIFTNEKIVNYRYSETALKMDPDKMGGLVMDIVPNDSCLIFCSSRKNCENVALLMTHVLFKNLITHKVEEKKKLLLDLKAEDSICPVLGKTIVYGVAYHHSGLTSEERRLLEEAFREGVLSVICCTSTLAAGVNLPARRVILRCPYMGNIFLNVSQYKQMIGRAGRTGMGEFGESILLCKPNEIEKVRNLLQSKIEDCMSQLNTEIGLDSLILSSIMLSIASTRAQLIRLISSSLLSIQSFRLDIDIKKIADNTIIKLMKNKIIKVKDETSSVDETINIASQNSSLVENDLISQPKKRKKVITLTSDSAFELSEMGRAAMKACINIETAHLLYDDLKLAQKHLILTNDLHLLYLIIPYDAANRTTFSTDFFDIISRLPPSFMDFSRLLGINEGVALKIQGGCRPKNINPIVINKFYLTLALHEVMQKQQPVPDVAAKYGVDRGTIQNLIIGTMSFASCVIKFSQEFPEFWAFVDLFTAFVRRLNNSSSVELEVLLELPYIKIARARQLYQAGFKTLQSIASAKPSDFRDIKHLSRKMIDRIIAAANVLLMEKVENLKDEVAEMMEGLNSSTLLT